MTKATRIFECTPCDDARSRMCKNILSGMARTSPISKARSCFPVRELMTSVPLQARMRQRYNKHVEKTTSFPNHDVSLLSSSPSPFPSFSFPSSFFLFFFLSLFSLFLFFFCFFNHPRFPHSPRSPSRPLLSLFDGSSFSDTLCAHILPLSAVWRT